ncbi:Uncharacterised protein [Serratia marcescens]|uniref:Universal stress protein n=1 Tax=Serratia marcescens TaxID=615 RepID=A0A380AR20_SERMA|nr:Uncharacterised protein [Serratia marcescens]
MKGYRHILVLIHNERDGLPLLSQAAAMVRGQPIALTVGHLNADYAELEYGSDALIKDRQAQEVIAAKAMLSRLVSAVDVPVAVKEIVTIRRFKDVSDFIHQAGIDLVVVGHQKPPVRPLFLLFPGVCEPSRCRCVGQAPCSRVACDKADFSHGFAARKAIACGYRYGLS